MDIFFLINLFILFILFLAVLGLCCSVQSFSSCGERGPLFVAVHGLLVAVASLDVEHRLQGAGSVAVAHGPSCSAACGILPDQGSNPCPLHRQADSQPLHHEGSPMDILKHTHNIKSTKIFKFETKFYGSPCVPYWEPLLVFHLKSKERRASLLQLALGFHCVPQTPLWSLFL